MAEPIVVRGTEVLATDPRRAYHERIARITLDSMVQFVGLLDAEGMVLEIGDLRVRSFEGLGSAFTLTLPRG